MLASPLRKSNKVGATPALPGINPFYRSHQLFRLDDLSAARYPAVFEIT
jgi:hypothetical protein